MTAAEFESTLTERYEGGAAAGWGELILRHELFEAAMDIALQPASNTPYPFRASYALERAFLEAPQRFVPYYDRFVRDFLAVTHHSVFRHYGKIMATLLKKRQLRLTDDEAHRVAEAALWRLVDESVAVGARVWSLDILYHLRPRLPWIDSELPAVIDTLKRNPSPATISRLRRYGWMKK